MQTQILHTTVAVPFNKAYDFARKPENFPKWAAGMSSSLRKTDTGWAAETPAGEATIRFSEPNEFGILDHWVKLSGKPEMYMPLRMIENGDETEVELVLFRLPEMSDEDFDRDAMMVKKDLNSLKLLLQQSA